jgi:hypothetical protein
LILALAYLLTPRMGATGLAAAYVGGWAVALMTVSIISSRLGLNAIAAESVASPGREAS